MDLFVVHACQDGEYAGGLEDSLAGRGSSSGSRPGRGQVSDSSRRSTRGSTTPAMRSWSSRRHSWRLRGPVGNWTGSRPEAGSWRSSRTSSRRTWQDTPPGSQSPRSPAPRPSGWLACSVPGRRPGRSNSRSRDGDLVRTPPSLTPGTNRPCAGATRCVRGDGRLCREHAGQRPRERFGEVYRASWVSRTLK